MPKNKFAGIHTINHNEIKNRSHRYDINRPRSRHGHKCSKYKKFLSIVILYVFSNTEATFQFMKELSNTEAELKKSVAYMKL